MGNETRVAADESTVTALNCPTCGAPVDYIDDIVLRRGQERRQNRSYSYQQPPAMDMREVRLEAIERFVKLVQLEVDMEVSGPRHGPDAGLRAMGQVLETIRQQVRGWVRG